MSDPNVPIASTAAYTAPPSQSRTGRGYRLALLLVSILALLIGAILLVSGLAPVPAATNLSDLTSQGTALGVHIRDQVAGAMTLFLGGIGFLLWLTTGALRAR